MESFASPSARLRAPHSTPVNHACVESAAAPDRGGGVMCMTESGWVSPKARKFEVSVCSSPRSPVPKRLQQMGCVGPSSVSSSSLRPSSGDAKTTRSRRDADSRRAEIRAEQHSRVVRHLELVERRREAAQLAASPSVAQQRVSMYEMRLAHARARRESEIAKRASRAAMFLPLSSRSPVPSPAWRTTHAQSAAAAATAAESSPSTPVAESNPSCSRRLDFGAEPGGGEGRVMVTEEVQKHESHPRREAAAVRLQRAFRALKLRRELVPTGPDDGSSGMLHSMLLRTSFDVNMNIELRTVSFEDTTRAVQSPAAVRFAHRVLELVYSPRQLSGGGRAARLARVLLSAFVVAWHPDHVMDSVLYSETNASGSTAATASSPSCSSSDVAAIERRTVALARAMISAVVSATNCNGDARRVSTLRSVWRAWSAAFMSWKEMDSRALQDAMIADALATVALKHAVLARAVSGEERQQWSADISAKIEDIRAGLVKVGGQSASARLSQALEQAEQRALLQHMAASRSENDTLMHELLVDGEDARQLHSSASSGLAERVSRVAHNAFWARFKEQVEDSDDARTIEAVDDILRDCWKGLLAAKRGGRAFSAEESGHEPEPRVVVVCVERKGLGGELRTVLQELRALQAEVLDSELDAFAAESLTSLAEAGDVSASGDYWEPAACATVAALLRANAELVENVMRSTLQRISELERDCLRARIQMLLPALRAHGPQLERERFRSLYFGDRAGGNHQLAHDRVPHTHTWLLQTAAAQQRRLNSELLSRGNIREVTRMVRLAVVECLDIPDRDGKYAEQTALPEVLSLDIARLLQAQADVEAAAKVCALHSLSSAFLVAKNACGTMTGLEARLDFTHVSELVRELAGGFAGSGAESLLATSETGIESVAKELIRAVSACFISGTGENRVSVVLSEEDLSSLRMMARGVCAVDGRGCSGGHASLYSLFMRRCSDVLRDAVELGDDHLDLMARAPAVAPARIIPHALHLLQPALRSLVRLHKHLMAVHGDLFVHLLARE